MADRAGYTSQFVDDVQRVVVGVPGVMHICDTLVGGIYDEQERGAAERQRCHADLAVLREKARDAFAELGEELKAARGRRTRLQEEVHKTTLAVEAVVHEQDGLGRAGMTIPPHAQDELQHLAGELSATLAQIEQLRAEKLVSAQSLADIQAQQREAEAAVEHLQQSAASSLQAAHAEQRRLLAERDRHRASYAQTIKLLQARLQTPLAVPTFPAAEQHLPAYPSTAAALAPPLTAYAPGPMGGGGVGGGVGGIAAYQPSLAFTT